MHSSMIVAGLFAVLAVASPIKAIHKKDIVYDITTEIVYVTVTDYSHHAPATSHTHEHHTQVQSSVKPVSTSVYVAPPPKTTTTPPPPPPPPATTSTPPPAPITTSEAPVVTVAKAPAASSAPAAALPTDYISSALYHHNKHRANHSSPDLTWDDTLASYAKLTADKCIFAHDMTEGTAGYGQNLAAYGTTGDLNSLDLSNLVADAITNQWYYGEAANVPYGIDSPDVNGPEFLHFTALVWKASTTVGCATVQCPAGSIFPYHSLYTVCDYKSEGNVLGAFSSNVQRPIGLPGITASIS